MDSAISVQGVSKTFRVHHDRNHSLKATVLSGHRTRFDEFVALDDISLEIPEGKTFGLMGHNGSGKSTLLKCIARILQPNKGQIISSGRMAAMLEVGSGFHPDLTGRENVYLNGAILGMSKAEIDRKFDAIVDFSGVEEFIDQPVKNYSSGMYVRLGFSISIHVEPEILVVDEVLAVGDLSFQEKCLDKFAEFRKQGRTVVVVSHSLELMKTFCDEAAWLQKGKLVEVGPAAGIVNRYANVEHQAKEVATGGTRFGSGEAEVTKIEWINDAGEDTRTSRTGDHITMRVHYNAKQRIERPAFGVSMDSREGVFVWGHTALDSGPTGYIPDAIEPGPGSIDIDIPSLPVRPGAFELSASIQDAQMTRVFDALQRAVRVDVLEGNPVESGGLVTFGSSFGNLKPERPIVPREK